jgi:periplasmic divalent cation tolerance protein
MKHVEIHFTVDNQADADSIVGALLAERLVACGQRIGPIISRYWWSGSIQHTEEWLVLLKTRSELTERVIDAVVEHHPYETPEVVALPIVSGHPGYLDWVDAVTGTFSDVTGGVGGDVTGGVGSDVIGEDKDSTSESNDQSVTPDFSNGMPDEDTR